MSSVPASSEGAGGDPASALAARIDAIEGFLRTTTGLGDEKALKELRRTIEALAKRDPKFEERVNDKVDVLADRIATVAKTVSTASAAGAAKDGEIAQLRRDLESTVARVNAGIVQAGRGADSAELVEIRRQLDELSKLAKHRMPRGLEGRVDELAAKFELVSQRVDSVSTTVSTTAAGLSGREGDVNALRRMVETERDRTGVALDELRRGIDTAALADLRRALKEHADEAARRQHAQQNLIGQVGAKIDQLTAVVAGLSTSQESTAGRVSAAEEALSAFRAHFEDARGRLNALLTDHRQTLAALSERAAALEQGEAGAGQARDQRLADLGERLEQLARRFESSERAKDEVAQGLENRVTDAFSRIEGLVGRLDPLQATVVSTTERLEARDGELREMERQFEDAGERVEQLVADLSRALGELPDPHAVERALTTRIDSVAEEAAGRHDALGAALAAATSSIAGLEAELSTMRSRFEQAGEQVGAQLADQKQVLGALAARAAVLEQTSGTATDELDQRVADVHRELRELGGSLESSSTALSSTSARISETEEEISALREYVEKAGTRFGSLLAEQTGVLSTLAERTAALERSEGDAFAGFDERIAALSGRIDVLSDRVDPRLAHLNELAERFEELSAQVGAADEHRDENASEIARLAAVLEVERASLGRRLDAFAVALENDGPARDVSDLEHKVAGLVTRIETLDGERASVQGQFDAIAKALASIPHRSSVEERLDDLSRRLDEVEQRGASVATKVSHASTLLPTALRSLESRLDEVESGRVSGPVADSVETPSSAPPRADQPEPPEPYEPAASASATIVPLRAGEP